MSRLASGKVAFMSPRDVQCICLARSSSSIPLCFIDHGHILWRSHCFPKVRPAQWFEPGQLETALGLRRNELDCFVAGFYRLALFENIAVTITGGELLVKCLQVDGERKFDLCCWSTPLKCFLQPPLKLVL